MQSGHANTLSEMIAIKENMLTPLTAEILILKPVEGTINFLGENATLNNLLLVLLMEISSF